MDKDGVVVYDGKQIKIFQPSLAKLSVTSLAGDYATLWQQPPSRIQHCACDFFWVPRPSTPNRRRHACFSFEPRSMPAARESHSPPSTHSSALVGRQRTSRK
jgi:hypothetical protein